MTIHVDTAEHLQEIVREQSRVAVRAGGTKTALSASANVDLAALRGVVEYEPTEYTFTARAATPLSEIQQLLATNQQFMPFDPMLVRAGATIGGSLASGISGPGRFRYGGLRDFLLGVRLVNGEGDLVRGGGKVVKNAAGFDIPKLLVGSLGQFGIVTEATFKVFPRPEAYATLRVQYTALGDALEGMRRVATSAAEAACLDLLPAATLLIRVGGITQALEQRIDRVKRLCEGTIDVLLENDDERIWDEARELTWRTADQSLLRIAITPRLIPQIEEQLANVPPAARRYSVGGHLLWLCWPESGGETRLEDLLRDMRASALTVMGSGQRRLLNQPDNVFGDRLRQVFDPSGKFRT